MQLCPTFGYMAKKMLSSCQPTSVKLIYTQVFGHCEHFSVPVLKVALSGWAGRSSRHPRSSPRPPPSALSSARPSVTTSRRSTRTPLSACAAVTLRSWSITPCASCSGPTQQPRGSTPQTPTLCSSGCTASSWWHSTIKLMVRTDGLERCTGKLKNLSPK